MSNKPFLSLRRFSKCALPVLLAGCLGAGAHAQATPTIASFVTGLNATPASGSFNPGTIPNVATDTFGDVLAVDDVNGELYEFPANGGDVIVLVPENGLFSVKGAPAVTPGLAIDSSNNLYIEGGSCVLMYPYANWGQLATTFTGSSGKPAVDSSSACGSASTFVNLGSGVIPMGMAIYGSNLLVATSSPSGNTIVSVPVTGAWTAPVAGTPSTIIAGMAAPAISVAADPAGNIYFVEIAKGALSQVYEIPAGQTGLTTDAGLARIGPAPTTDLVTGVATDSQGNVYISDNPNGVYLFPQGSGSSGSAVLLTGVPAQGAVELLSNGNLLVPTLQVAAGVSQVAFNAAQFGSLAVGAKPASGSVLFSFNSAQSITPHTVEVLEAGKSNADFAVAIGSSSGIANCITDTQATSGVIPPPYAAQTSCAVNLTFTPQTTGAVSASLTMLDAKDNLIASIPLNGIGVGGAVQALPGAQSTIGSGLMTPSQIAVDAAGNLYVADSGLGAVQMYAAGSGAGASGTAVGQNLKAPTGVAVDGAGDVFIADSGSIYEVPETANGLNSKGQVTITAPSLGAHVQLAADNIGDLYISDVDNQKVYELQNLSAGTNAGLPAIVNTQTLTLSGAAFTTPSAIAVDDQNNLYVVNGGVVYQVTPAGTQTQVLTGLTGASGLALDPSGSVYAIHAGGAARIPNEAGTLNKSDARVVASNVTNPTSVAVDSMGNIYVADGTALNVNVTSASTAVDFGTLTADPTSAPPPPGSSSSQTVTLLNYGNTALNVTGYNSPLNYFPPDPSVVGYAEADFLETADTCTGNSIAIDSTCTATVTFSAAPGDGGTLTGQVLVLGNVGNAPVGVNGTGIAPALAGSATTMTVSTAGTIEGVPVSVTVAPSASGSPTPTGTVTLTVQYGNNVPLTNCQNPNCVYPSLPSKYQLTATLDSTGKVTFDPIELPIANYTFTARYNGDPTYIYEHSDNSGPVAVATPVPVALTQPAPPPSSLGLGPLYQLPCTSGSGSNCTTSYNYDQPAGNPPGYLVLVQGQGSQEDYGGDWTNWKYTYPVTIASASSDPMVALALYSSGSQTGWNYGAINYVMANGKSVCGDSAGSKSIINVDHTQAPGFEVSCAQIDTSNNTIPNIMTYYSLTPEYSGTANDLASINPNYESTKGSAIGFWALSHPMVQLSASPASLSVPSGKSGSTTLTLTSVLGYGFVGRNSAQNNYGAPLDLQCQGLPAYATCTFTYPTPSPADTNFIQNPGGLLCANNPSMYCAIDIGPDPGVVNGRSINHNSSPNTPCDGSDGCLGPGMVTMTVTTNTPVGTVTSKLQKDKGGIAFAALFGLGLLGLRFRRKAAGLERFLMVVCVLAFGGAFIGITACSTTNIAQSTAAVTPSGSYWVTVTARQTGSVAIPCSSGANCVKGIQLVPGQGTQMSLPYTIQVTVQ